MPIAMKPIRLAFFLVLLVCHAILVILSLNFSQSTADSIVRNPSAFRFLTFFGLAVFLITFAFAWFDRRRAVKKIEKLEAEKNAIKAEVFDREKRAQEREREIEEEIKSFEKSLPSNQSAAANPDRLELPRSEPGLAEPSPAEPSPAEPSPAEPHLAEPRLSEPYPEGEEEVEYGPLVPKNPEYGQSDTDPAPSGTDPDRDDTDTNPFRS